MKKTHYKLIKYNAFCQRLNQCFPTFLACDSLQKEVSGCGPLSCFRFLSSSHMVLFQYLFEAQHNGNTTSCTGSRQVDINWTFMRCGFVHYGCNLQGYREHNKTFKSIKTQIVFLVPQHQLCTRSFYWILVGKTLV